MDISESTFSISFLQSSYNNGYVIESEIKSNNCDYLSYWY